MRVGTKSVLFGAHCFFIHSFFVAFGWWALGETLDSWKEEIACMWRFTRNNGITEGFHNKMETISRVAYGFRNFENYRRRVKVLCS